MIDIKIYKEQKNNQVTKKFYDMNKVFFKRESKMSTNYLQEHLTPLVLNELKIKSTLRFQFTWVRIAKVNNLQEVLTKMWRKGRTASCWEKWRL